MSTTLTAVLRSDFGKEKAKKIRRSGFVPGVIYGASGEPEHVQVGTHDLDVLAKRVHGQTLLVDLEVKDAQGKSHVEKVFLRELQRDPVTDRIIHVDILRVDMTKPVVVDVPVVGVGMPAGVKEGGLLETLARVVTIRCLPQNVPPHIDLDITGIALTHSLHVGDATWPANIEVLTSKETALFTVLGKRGEEETAAVAAVPGEGEGEPAAAAEPEVIGKKKKEEDEKKSKD